MLPSLGIPRSGNMAFWDRRLAYKISPRQSSTSCFFSNLKLIKIEREKWFIIEFHFYSFGKLTFLYDNWKIYLDSYQLHFSGVTNLMSIESMELSKERLDPTDVQLESSFRKMSKNRRAMNKVGVFASKLHLIY